MARGACPQPRREVARLRQRTETSSCVAAAAPAPYPQDMDAALDGAAAITRRPKTVTRAVRAPPTRPCGQELCGTRPPACGVQGDRAPSSRSATPARLRSQDETPGEAGPVPCRVDPEPCGEGPSRAALRLSELSQCAYVKVSFTALRRSHVNAYTGCASAQSCDVTCVTLVIDGCCGDGALCWRTMAFGRRVMMMGLATEQVEGEPTRHSHRHVRGFVAGIL